MKKFLKFKQLNWPLPLGLLVGLLSLFSTVQLALAQDDAEPDAPVIPTQECQECHLDVANIGKTVLMLMPLTTRHFRRSGRCWVSQVSAWPAIPLTTNPPLVNLMKQVWLVNLAR